MGAYGSPELSTFDNHIPTEKCWKCGKTYRALFKRCPFCNAKKDKGSRSITAIIIVALVIGAILAIASGDIIVGAFFSSAIIIVLSLLLLIIRAVRKQTLTKVVLVFVCSLVAAVVTLVLIGTRGATQVNTDSSADTVQEATSNNASENKTPEEASFYPVEIVSGNAGNWEITINNFKYTDNIPVNAKQQYTSQDNCKFCVINVSVKNCGKEPDTFLPYLTYGSNISAIIKWNDYTYAHSVLTESSDDLSNKSINPLISTTGNIAFELPDEIIDSSTPTILVFTAGQDTFECTLENK